ncbi:TIGR03773 family transporter-associated surface protein [Saccharothrix coeruleofusca]|uniref:Surface-anchored protein n=1 Tax=Saccharothrix coeruleofusca TaxID=33919 RepID=A0A918ASP7_9PSEU|nr:TIGR03773 family transporter-associated surface protein [Saccharothrix coeruleofusca]GGP66069.1 hypothetical protein GCM10010185_43320 [Saccharothrix coeruleofusca]
MTTSTRRRTALGALAAAALAALSSTPVVTAALAQDATPVVDRGHVDLLAPAVVDGALKIRYKDGSTEPPTIHDPEHVVTHVKPESVIQVPDIPEYAFLGPVGSDLWLIPEIQNPDVVWAGWNTESLTADRVAPDSVRWTLDAIGGDAPGSAAPGKLTVFQTGPVGEPLPRVFDTSGPLPQSTPLVPGTHAHANWTFSAQGVYRLTFTVEATTPDGTPLRDTTTYAIAVGAVDPSTVRPGTGTPPSSSSSPPASSSTPSTTTTTTTTTTSTASTTTPSTPPKSCVVLDDGHVDLIAPRLLDGALRTGVKDGAAGPERAVWREPADVVLHVVPEARNTVPADPAYAFLGAPGTPVWLIPQTQVPGVVWAGWNTESLTPQQVSGDVEVSLSAVEGPGEVAVFLTGIAPTVLVDSGDGLPDAITVPLGTHAHANWAFGGEGVYRITVEVTATLADGRAVADRDVFTIAVGDVDPTAGEDCAPPSTTSTTSTTPAPTGTATTGPLTTTRPVAAAPRSAGLASTGVGGVGTIVLLAVVLATAGALALVLARRRRSHGG